MAKFIFEKSNNIKSKDEIDLSNKGLLQWPSQQLHPTITKLDLQHNSLTKIPREIVHLATLREFDVSNNQISKISEDFCSLASLEVFIAKSNQIKELPENLAKLKSLKTLNLSGNLLSNISYQICDLSGLVNLQLGANQIEEVPKEIIHLNNLEFLYLGGNSLKEVPSEIGELKKLCSLNLSSNQITTLPRELSYLLNLKSLTIHNNQLHYLPQNIVLLQNLEELALRNNPLVNKFIHDLTYNVNSLVEICGRLIKRNKIAYRNILPRILIDYLDCAQHCDNPECDGVYFQARVKQVKFVDFCGRYRVPLLEYLCSHCHDPPNWDTTSSSEEDELSVENKKSMNRVLLTKF